MAAAEAPYRVMLVDDSAVVRGLMTRWMLDDGDFAIVGSVGSGLSALKQLERCDPEIAILDIEMPEMDGLTALPILLQASPDLKIIMASTLTHRNAEVTLKALAAGAADYIAKPTSTRETNTTADYRRELLSKVRALGAAGRQHGRRRAARPDMPLPAARAVAKPAAQAIRPIALRPSGKAIPAVLAIGSSTGGPQALFELFGSLVKQALPPVLITQHMPPTFTTILADHLQRVAGIPCAEAKDGEPIVAGRIYIAPGDWHMTVAQAERPVIRLDKNPPENFCRPSVDPLFRSVAKSYRERVLALVLTGMGTDGLRGSQDIAAAGGDIVAQDEASSVVWGMPGAVATAGLCTAVLPLAQLGPALGQMLVRSTT